MARSRRASPRSRSRARRRVKPRYRAAKQLLELKGAINTAMNEYETATNKFQREIAMEGILQARKNVNKKIDEFIADVEAMAATQCSIDPMQD